VGGRARAGARADSTRRDRARGRRFQDSAENLMRAESWANGANASDRIRGQSVRALTAKRKSTTREHRASKRRSATRAKQPQTSTVSAGPGQVRQD